MKKHQLFITCAKGLELLLQQELQEQGIDSKQTVAGVYVSGTLKEAYRICLWSRLASRVLLQLKKINVDVTEELYEGISEINWSEHMNADSSMVIDFNGTSTAIDNSHFGALKVKDAIADQFRKKSGERPSIDKDNPDLRINCHLAKDAVTVSIDLSGKSLHQRGYRQATGGAPLKENIASAMLLYAKWPEIAKRGDTIIDPMCGSGTILIEALMMAANIAPGLYRKSFGFVTWKGHDQNSWKEVLDEAEKKAEQGLEQCNNKLIGYDNDPSVIDKAQKTIKDCGFEQWISVQAQEVSDLEDETKNVGLVICNPPYGVRLGEVEQLHSVYASFGERLKQYFSHCTVGVLTNDLALVKAMRFFFEKKYRLFNGAIECKFYVCRGR